MKNFKNLMFIVAVLCLCCGLLAGCGGDDPGEENPAESGATKTDVPTGDYLADKYNLDTDEITIYCWDKAEPLAVITDPADIEALQDSVDFASWEYVPSEEGYDGIEEYYVHFNDDVFIGVYRDIPYGFIAKGTMDDHQKTEDGFFNMSESFLQTVLQMVEKYSK